MEGVLPVAPKNAPRCNLEGYGFFKGASWRKEGRRGGRRREKRTVLRLLRKTPGR